MRVTLFTEYSFKVLLYLAGRDAALVTVDEVARECHMSKNHLVKVIQNLVHSDFVNSVRGKHGGIRLARAPELINLGDVARQTGMNLDNVDCFDTSGHDCPFVNDCKLKYVIRNARRSYMATMDGYTLDAIL
ncbi:Nitrite-sensitive transcriptional repressor NsrR [hydrothermal vent metagenome]|uniref:Nitrite-sensitive transcriptional repressor NsrR n=1 Tax=hydrothermal vent metagenome TaxID=652676 RepID=A0A3B1AKH3_9ZZZZ